MARLEDPGQDGWHRPGHLDAGQRDENIKSRARSADPTRHRYKGTADVRLAAESGEIAGGCWGWDSVSVTWRKALDSGDAVVVLQANRRSHPDLPNIPQAIKFAKTDEARKMIDVGIHGDSDIVRTYTLPPGTPKDRVQLLRKAFDATLKDPEFVADAKKSRLTSIPSPPRIWKKIFPVCSSSIPRSSPNSRTFFTIKHDTDIDRRNFGAGSRRI